MSNDHQFDELLDHALSEYRDAEPLSGLEERVHQRLQSQSPGRPGMRWLWAAVAGCAALVLVGVWIGMDVSSHLPSAGREDSHPTATKQQPLLQKQVAPAAPDSQPHERTTAHTNERNTPAGIHTHASSMLVARTETATQNATATERFPTPAPLTAEEHALFAVLQANPDALPQQIEASHDTTILPLEIKPLPGSAEPNQENSNE